MLLVLFLTACPSTPNNAHVDAGPDPSWKPVLPPTWTDCPLSLTGDPARRAECAEIQLPMDHDSPDGGTLAVFVKRVRGTAALRRQVWLVHGGISNAEDFSPYLEKNAGSLDEIDFYLLDHRGAGRSSRLECDAIEEPTSEAGTVITVAEWMTCLDKLNRDWGTDLQHFNTRQAAHDLATLIGALREPDTPILVYGVSYGTYWVQRYMEAFPHQADGVVLDSIVSHANTFTRADFRYHDGGRAWFTLCASDPRCTAQLGADPWARYGQILDQLKTGHCPELATARGVDAARLHYETRRLFTMMQMYESLRAFGPSVAWRLGRCSAADVPILTRGYSTLLDPSGGLGRPTLGSTWPIFFHVFLSERWDDSPPVCDALETEVDGLFMYSGAPVKMCRVQHLWPRYDPGPRAFPTVTRPLLLLHGALDPQASLTEAQPAIDALASPHTTTVIFPTAPHGILAQTPMAGTTETCGERIVHAFFRDPTAPVDSTCADTSAPADFSGRADYARFIFGVSDTWAP